MKPRVKYTTNRKYRDFVDVEEDQKTVKKSILLKKKKGFLAKLKNLFKK
jgi:hypothetical protein